MYIHMYVSSDHAMWHELIIFFTFVHSEFAPTLTACSLLITHELEKECRCHHPCDSICFCTHEAEGVLTAVECLQQSTQYDNILLQHILDVEILSSCSCHQKCLTAMYVCHIQVDLFSQTCTKSDSFEYRAGALHILSLNFRSLKVSDL